MHALSYIPDPGTGPKLSYAPLPTGIGVSCSTAQVYPEPALSLTWHSEPTQDHAMADMTTTTARRGMLYDVAVEAMLSSSLSPQTVFSCSMQIPGTQFSLTKKTMYSRGTVDIARASKVSGGVRRSISDYALSVIMLATMGPGGGYLLSTLLKCVN